MGGGKGGGRLRPPPAPPPPPPLNPLLKSSMINFSLNVCFKSHQVWETRILDVFQQKKNTPKTKISCLINQDILSIQSNVLSCDSKLFLKNLFLALKMCKKFSFLDNLPFAFSETYGQQIEIN